MAGVYQPLHPLSPDNQGPANSIVSWVLIVSTLLFASVRFAVGRERLLQLDIDDATFGAAVVFAIATSIVSQLMVSAGLGRHQSTLSPEALDRYFKLFYASQFLAIAAQAFAKTSIVLLFRKLVPAAQSPLTFIVLLPCIGVWTVCAWFIVAFQCRLPQLWKYDLPTCASHGRGFYAVMIMNMLSDALLATWLLPSIWRLQMRGKAKMIVSSLFASRIAVCAVTVGQIIVMERCLASPDQTWSSLGWAILDQVVVHLSINHATLPRIHVFLAGLQTGLLTTRLATDNMRLANLGRQAGRNLVPKRIQRLSKSLQTPTMDSSKLSKETSHSEEQLRLRPDEHNVRTSIYASVAEPQEAPVDDTNGKSQSEPGNGRQPDAEEGGVQDQGVWRTTDFRIEVELSDSGLPGIEK